MTNDLLILLQEDSLTICIPESFSHLEYLIYFLVIGVYKSTNTCDFLYVHDVSMMKIHRQDEKLSL